MNLNRVKPWDFYSQDLEEKRKAIIAEYNSKGKAFQMQAREVATKGFSYIVPPKRFIK